MRVVHPQFGAGTVLSASGRRKLLALDIRFERAGRKKILAAYTTRVEEWRVVWRRPGPEHRRTRASVPSTHPRSRGTVPAR